MRARDVYSGMQLQLLRSMSVTLLVLVVPVIFFSPVTSRFHMVLRLWCIAFSSYTAMYGTRASAARYGQLLVACLWVLSVARTSSAHAGDTMLLMLTNGTHRTLPMMAMFFGGGAACVLCSLLTIVTPAVQTIAKRALALPGADPATWFLTPFEQTLLFNEAAQIVLMTVMAFCLDAALRAALAPMARELVAKQQFINNLVCVPCAIEEGGRAHSDAPWAHVEPRDAHAAGRRAEQR
jgi:hypothetical protein